MPGDDKVILSVAPGGFVGVTRGSNSARVQVMDNRVIHQWVTQALADNDDSTKLKGRATQRMAAAIIAQVSAWNELGHPDSDVDNIPALAQVNRSKETRNAMLPLLKKAFFDQTPIGPNPDPNVKAAVTGRRAAENSLLGRAVKVACIIVRGNMTLASFNTEVGQFTVPKDMILLTDHYWTGYMASPKAPATVLLDGRVYSCSTMNVKTQKETLTRVSASVDTLIRVAIPAKRTPQTDTKVDWSALAKVDAPLDWLIDQLHRQLCETEADPSDEGQPMNGALVSEKWGKLSDIAQWSDSEQSKPGFVKDALDKELAAKRA
jgi:hypothetical protein